MDLFDAVTYDYGLNSDRLIPSSNDILIVVIPEVNLVLNSDVYAKLQRAVNPLQPSEDFGIDFFYEQALQLLATFRF